MKEITLSYQSRSIHLRKWLTEKPIANLFITHGLGEHSGRYQPIAEYFNHLGYNVYAHDHQGHGLSSGKQGHIDSFEIYSDDLKYIIETYSNVGLKNYLLGHSLGGVIATSFLIRYPNLIEKAIISAPGYQKKIPPNPVKAALGKMLAKIAPELTLWNEIEADWICSTQSVVDDYSNDPLVHDRVSAKFFTSFLAEFELIKQRINELKTPILMLLPGNDLVVDHQCSKVLFEQMTNPTNKLIEFPSAYHEVLNEEKDKILAYQNIQEWLN